MFHYTYGNYPLNFIIRYPILLMAFLRVLFTLENSNLGSVGIHSLTHYTTYCMTKKKEERKEEEEKEKKEGPKKRRMRRGGGAGTVEEIEQ